MTVNLSGLKSFVTDVSNMGLAGQPVIRNLVPINQRIWAFQVRHLNTQYFSYCELLLDQGATSLQLRRQGEVFRFGTPYDRGIDFRIPEAHDNLNVGTHPATSIEIVVALTQEAASLLQESTGDPWAVAESFILSAQQVGGAATNPEVIFCGFNVTGDQIPNHARLNALIVSTNVAGEIIIVNGGRRAAAGVPAMGKRTAPDLTYPNTNHVWNIQALGTLGAYPVGPWYVRQWAPANAPLQFNLGLELVTPNPVGGPSGDSVIVVGPQGTATLDVTADWQEKRAT